MAVSQPPDTIKKVWCPVCGHTRDVPSSNEAQECNGAWKERNLFRGRNWRSVERAIKEASHTPTPWVEITYVRADRAKFAEANMPPRHVLDSWAKNPDAG